MFARWFGLLAIFASLALLPLAVVMPAVQNLRRTLTHETQSRRDAAVSEREGQLRGASPDLRAAAPTGRGCAGVMPVPFGRDPPGGDAERSGGDDDNDSGRNQFAKALLFSVEAITPASFFCHLLRHFQERSARVR